MFEIKFVNSADEEMKALDKTDLKKVAVVNQYEFGSRFKNNKSKFQVDSLAEIKLVTYKPNYIKYTSDNTNDGLAVFSEMYYPKGWNVYIDGNKKSDFRVDYVLRSTEIPAGKHTIEFKFEPEVVKTGSTIALVTSILILVLLISGIYFENRKKKIAETS